MTITAADIKLLASERMTDTTDGGGRRTANTIPDGVPGNIFPKVSRLDSVYGRVNLRKVFGAVLTANVDTYAGAHAALIDGPDNDRIRVAIFSTNSDFDDRTAARDHIESYVVAGPESKMTSYGRQLAGQGAITAYQRVEETLPEVGDVYCLSNELNGITAYQQFVRIQDVTHEVRTFTDEGGDFQRRVITMKIGSPLRYEFDGIEVPSRQTIKVKSAVIRSTTVADAARYYGIQPVTGGVLAEALDLKVSSIYAPIVPTTTREAAIANAEIAGALALQQVSSSVVPQRPVGSSLPVNAVGTSTINLGTAVMPGTLMVKVDADSGGNIIFNQFTTDDGKGNIVVGNSSGITSGTIDYENGLLTVSYSWGGGTNDNWPGRLWTKYVPAVAVSQPAHTLELPVTIATRGTVQVVTLNPLPAKGTTIVDYRALGKWYRLRDDGTGALVGDDPAYGTGTVDPVTGSLVVTLGALPDVGSSVVFGWASPVHYSIRAGATSDADTVVRQKVVLPETPVIPASLVIAYTAGGVAYQATADASGAITGGGVTGTVDHTTGEVDIAYGARLPDTQTNITLSYKKKTTDPATSDPVEASGTSPYAPGDASILTTANVPIGGLSLKIQVMIPPTGTGAGGVVEIPCKYNFVGEVDTLPLSFTVDGIAYSHQGGVRVGDFDGASGLLTFNITQVALFRAKYQDTTYYVNGGVQSKWEPAAQIHVPLAAGDYAWHAQLSNGGLQQDATPVVVSSETAQLSLDLTHTINATVLPNSVFFALTGLNYFDRNGVLYHSVQPDGTGTPAGSIDYNSGKATLTTWQNNIALGIAVTGCLTKYGDFTAVRATFRTAGSPLRPSSAFIQVVAEDGETLTATSDQSGNLSGTAARGTVNEVMGVVHIEWGAMVPAAGHEQEPWYDASNVVGGQIWMPRTVMPSTIRYNAVVQTSLPLDADIIGLDPVRLPSDGRVPIFRPGDVILIHNTKVSALPNPLVAGATYNIGRTDLADLFIFDANGARLPTTQYVVDYTAGTVTMAANLDVGALVAPFSAKHRVEELNQASDVQINGEIALASPLSRDFDADTMVSGALLFGDLFARVSNVFDQVTWIGVWSDTLIGNNGSSEYNAISFPIEVSNDSAVTERWRINFTSQTAFQVIGENLGQIATGTTAADCSPVDPLSGKPYFTIRAAGWGGGWVVGQNLRFNTYGATAPVWMARTVLPGATLAGDSIDIQVRGDVDA